MTQFYRSRAVRLLCCITSVFTGVWQVAEARSAPWRPEGMPRSIGLNLDEIEALMLPNEPSQGLLGASEDLNALWLELLGYRLEVPKVYDPAKKQAFVLRFKEGEPYASEHSFLIQRRRSQVFVTASSDQGLINALYAISHEILGGRWYWPHELGFESMGLFSRKFPNRIWREEPAFEMRQLHPSGTDFARRNRLSGGYSFNHALGRVFGPELFSEEPEVFSEVKGRRREPRGLNATDPQPDFTEARTVEIAAAAALAHFEENPMSRSFSLSINDNALFDESEATQAVVTPLEYFRGRPDYTPLVFGFMNEVAEQVFDQPGANGEDGEGEELWFNAVGQPRYLTALAYYWTEQSPTFKLHPRVMPVLTSDRAQWHDLEYRIEDKALIRRWTDSGAERIATWDYYFGAPYPYPRQFNEWIVESIRFLHTEGVDVFFSQLPSMWGLDGPKAWLASQLLWNPNQDVEALLDEFYTNFFGSAGSLMRSFYERAEAHRNGNEGEAEWIKFYKDEAGIELFSAEVLMELRGYLDRAEIILANDPRRLARVRIVSEAFELTELMAAYQRTRRELLRLLWESRGSLDAALSDFIKARDRYLTRATVLVENPYHEAFRHFIKLQQSDPVPVSIHRLDSAKDKLPAAYDSALAISGILVNQPDRFQSLMPNIGLVHAADIAKPANFLGPPLPQIPGWFFDFRASELLSVQAPQGLSGGVRVEGADVVSLFTDVPVRGEAFYALKVKLAWQVSPDNRSQVKLTWSNEKGERLRVDLPVQLPNGSSGGIRALQYPVQAPVGASAVRIHFVTSRQYEGDFLELRAVDFGMVE